MTPYAEGAIVGWLLGVLTPIVGCALADWLYQRRLRKQAKRSWKFGRFSNIVEKGQGIYIAGD